MNFRVVTTEALSKKTINAGIQIEVENIAKTVDAKIREAHAAGLSTLMYELPETFMIKNMDQRDAQLVIYCNIIDIFETSGFIVGLKSNAIKGSEKISLIIRWINRITEEERERLEKIIFAHYEKT